MPAGIGRCAAVFLVGTAGVETGCLEEVCAQGHLVGAAARYLLLGGGEQAGAQAEPAQVRPDPQQVDVAALAPGPPEQPRAQVTAVFADGDAQQPAVGVAGRRGIKGVDLLVEAFSQTIVDITDCERGITRSLSASPYCGPVRKPRSLAARAVAIRSGAQEGHRIRLVWEAIPAPRPGKGRVGAGGLRGL
jgi:hypothetical protein